jgi:hypothetical protein
MIKVMVTFLLVISGFSSDSEPPLKESPCPRFETKESIDALLKSIESPGLNFNKKRLSYKKIKKVFDLKLTFDHLGKQWEMDDKSEKAINAYYRDFSNLQNKYINGAWAIVLEELALVGHESVPAANKVGKHMICKYKAKGMRSATDDNFDFSIKSRAE